MSERTGVCAVTGGNRGIGFETVRGLALRGERVVLVCRREADGEAAAAQIRTEHPDARIEVLGGHDLSNIAGVRGCAGALRERAPGLDVLVNNAGVICEHRRTTVDGFERTFAVNHLAPFLLTNLLRDLLERNAPSRVVTVASEAHRTCRLDLEDLQLETDYHPLRAYGRSKLANILFSYELARRCRGTGIAANCLHPGAVDTGLLEAYFRGSRWISWALPVFRPISLSPARGARTSIYVATARELEGVTGRYYRRCREKRSNPQTYDRDLAAALWERSATLTGLAPEEKQE